MKKIFSKLCQNFAFCSVIKYEKLHTIEGMGMHGRKQLINDVNFLREIEKGNEEALRYIIQKYGNLVRSVIGRYLYLLKEEQEECFDDVFLSIWEHIDSFDKTRNSFANWTAGIARYKAIDYLRRYKKQFEEVALDDTLASEDEKLLALMEDEISEETEWILQCLKPKERELFEKLFVEEMTIVQVSESLQTNPNVIYKRLSRARKRMRELFPERMS